LPKAATTAVALKHADPLEWWPVPGIFILAGTRRKFVGEGADA
jgi:hypothetical protein